MNAILKHTPDILIWTEHHLPHGTHPPRWVHILLQQYRWGLTGIPKIRGQAGVLMAVHKDLSAGTEPHILTPLEETQGFVYQMDIRRPESAPLLLTGVYLPTGPTAPYIRPGLYKHIERQHQAHPHHVHILAGDMNATLYPTDRDPGQKRLPRPPIQTIHKQPWPPPLGPPSDHTRSQVECGPSIPRVTPARVQ
jgi:hypothetical protein